MKLATGGFAEAIYLYRYSRK